jgi:hypothetical protein
MRPDLPSSVLARAYVSPGAGEFAWRRVDVPDAVRAIAAANCAILGGEVWLVLDPRENWTGLIPRRDGGPYDVWTWDTTPQRKGESWEIFRDRSAAETIASIQAMAVEEEAHPDIVPSLWFNISYVAAHEA